MNETVLELLAKYREDRATLEADLFPRLPPEVLEITLSEVGYTINPIGLPYKFVKFAELREVLKVEYGLEFVRPDPQSFGPLAKEIVQGSLADDVIGQAMLNSSSPDVVFEEGLFRVTPAKAISIRRVRFSDEQITVAFVAPTRAGELIIMELVRILWVLAGVAKSLEDCVRDIQLLAFGTATRVRFQDQLTPFLSAQFLRLTDGWSAPGAVGGRMGRRSSEEEKGMDRASAEFYLDELQFVVVRDAFGQKWESRFRIGVDRRSDRGSGVLTVTSELPFPEHIQLIESLLRP